MNCDVIKNRYGRLYEQPRQLAENDFDVEACCISYHCDEDASEIHATRRGLLKWSSWSVGRLFWRLPGCILFLIKKILRFNPDVVIAGSDQIHIIVGYFVARMCRCNFVVDLYDNFESYGIGRIPMLNRLYRFALSNAALVTCISPMLEHKLRREVGAGVQLASLLSTVDKTVFRPINRLEARETLHLPKHSLLVGTAGNLREKMGVRTLFEAIETMNSTFPQIIFVLAGVYGEDCPIPRTKNVMYLGKLDHAIIPYLVNSLDVAIIYQSDNDYGKFAFPQKAFEFAACKVPIVAADVGCMSEVFKDISQYMYVWNDSNSLVEVILKQVSERRISEVVIEDWMEHGQRLAVLTRKVVGRDAGMDYS